MCHLVGSSQAWRVVWLTQNMYENARSRFQCESGHSPRLLSPLLFIMVLEALSQGCILKKNICFHTWWRFENWGQSMWKLCNISQKQYFNWPKPKFPENSLIFYCFLKFPEDLGKFPEISLIFNGKAISLSFPECVGTLRLVMGLLPDT